MYHQRQKLATIKNVAPNIKIKNVSIDKNHGWYNVNWKGNYFVDHTMFIT